MTLPLFLPLFFPGWNVDATTLVKMPHLKSDSSVLNPPQILSFGETLGNLPNLF